MSADNVRGAFDAYWRIDREDHQTTLGDLLADLMHFADAEGLDFAQALRSGEMHHAAETHPCKWCGEWIDSNEYGEQDRGEHTPCRPTKEGASR